jgi:hypothetical protein
MDCAEIQKLLSEYIDGTLDAKIVQAVETHISACEDCSETLVSLRTMIEELNALEPLKAPADFLEKIHQRMEPRSNFSRLFRKLFVPFKIKIPLQLAAAATASILVVMVLNLQKSEYHKMQPLKAPEFERSAQKSKTEPPIPVLEEAPKSLTDSEQVMPPQRSRVKTHVQPSIQRESKPSFPVLTKARPSMGKGHPIELALVLKPVVIGSAYAPDIAMQTIPLSEGDQKTTEKEGSDKETFGKKFETEQNGQVDLLILKINHIIWPLKGTILTKEYNQQKDRLKSIYVQIPAENYTVFCRDLNSLGTFKAPPPVLSDKNLKTVNLLLSFSYPE